MDNPCLSWPGWVLVGSWTMPHPCNSDLGGRCAIGRGYRRVDRYRWCPCSRPRREAQFRYPICRGHYKSQVESYNRRQNGDITIKKNLRTLWSNTFIFLREKISSWYGCDMSEKIGMSLKVRVLKIVYELRIRVSLVKSLWYDKIDNIHQTNLRVWHGANYLNKLVRIFSSNQLNYPIAVTVRV